MQQQTLYRFFHLISSNSSDLKTLSSSQEALESAAQEEAENEFSVPDCSLAPVESLCIKVEAPSSCIKHDDLDSKPSKAVIKSDDKECDKARMFDSGKLSDARTFQKTRSFSAVEDSSKKKNNQCCIGIIKEFHLKDQAHSRSEHLEIQSNQANDEEPSEMIASSSTIVDRSELLKTDAIISSLVDRASGEDTLIMQFDYFSNDQPMSLQHEASYANDNLKQQRCQMRKSGRDLTELETQNSRAVNNRTKSDRTRPRLG